MTLLGIVVLAVGLSFGALEQRKTLLAVSAEDVVSSDPALPALLHFRNQSRIREALALKLRLEKKPKNIWLRALHVDGEILAKAPGQHSDSGTTAFIRTFNNRLEVLSAVDLFAHNSAAHYQGTLAAIPFMDAQFKISTPVFSPIDPIRTDVPQSAYQQTLAQRADQPRRFVAGYIEQGIFLGDILETIIPTLGQALAISIAIGCTALLTFWFFMHQAGVKAAQLMARNQRSEHPNLTQKGGSPQAPIIKDRHSSRPQDQPAEDSVSAPPTNFYTSTDVDPVTNLPCRQRLLEHVAMLMDVAAKEHRYVGLILLEVSSIGPILHARGREVSDDILREITSRISNSIRRYDMASRGFDASGKAILDADQFCIVLHSLDNIQSLHSAAERLLDLTRLPVNVAGETLNLSVVASAAAAPQHGKTPEGLISAAKSALIKARELRAPNPVFFYH